MSEYNIQMNKYNAINAGYDQLYPQPMKHASTHAKDGNDPITPSMIGTYTQTKIDTLLQKKADSSSVYTKSESISAETRTALSLAETATPDAALAEIARQLSERTTLLWENAAPASQFFEQSIAINGLQNFDFVLVDYQEARFSQTGGCAICSTRIGAAGVLDCYVYGKYWFDSSRNFRIVENGISFSNCYIYGTDDGGYKVAETNNGYNLPMKIYGLMA